MAQNVEENQIERATHVGEFFEPIAFVDRKTIAIPCLGDPFACTRIAQGIFFDGGQAPFGVLDQCPQQPNGCVPCCSTYLVGMLDPARACQHIEELAFDRSDQGPATFAADTFHIVQW